ncbi:vitamin B12 transporter [Dyadobacter jejuensis]|uniref:Vitamin B12 transporter n=2 Tax=Dyadobacter jejuensis TaxID=1082580 RepID=A0A316AXT9_9BACT|nr:vitamin B12 transporter [Dyadobacter jejuensis]
MAVLAGGTSYATPFPADTLSPHQLDPVVVTATRSAHSRDRIAQKIEVLTPNDLQMTPSNDLTDLVRKLAAVDVIQYPTLSSGVGIRGFRPQFSGLNQRTLLLIDGCPAGATNLSLINLNGIQQIEVLKGPASALYGSQAMGGVINVISAHSKGTPRGKAWAEYGSFQTSQLGLQVGGNLTKKLDFDLSGSTFERGADYTIGKNNLLRKAFHFDNALKYYSAQPQASVSETLADGQQRPNTQFHQYAGMLRVGYQIDEKWRIDLRGEKFQAKDVESPGDISSGSTEASKKDVDRSALDFTLTGDHGTHQASLKVYGSEENTTNYVLNEYGKPIAPYRSAQSQNQWKGLQLKDIWSLGPHSLTIGYDYLKASNNSRRWYNDSTARAPYQPDYALITSALYVQAFLDFGRLSLQPGLRNERITYEVKTTDLLPSYQAGKKNLPFVSPSLGLTYRLLPGLKVKANMGRGFVTADAYSVAGYNEVRDSQGRISITQGNPDLKNESSLSWDLGLSFLRPNTGWSATLTYFNTSVTNRIAKVTTKVDEPQPNGDKIVSRAQYVNATEAHIQGIETEIQYDFGFLADHRYSLRAFLNGTSFLKAQEGIRQADASILSRDIHNVAKNTFNYGLEYDNLAWMRLRLTARNIGHRQDIDYTDVLNPLIRYPQYMVADLAATFSIENRHQLTLKVSNMTDENYYEKRGYNLPGRAISLRYQILF